MLENVQIAPPDAIFGLIEAFSNDSRDPKVNLSIGVYKDPNGKTPVLDTVKLAAEHVLATQGSKSYLGISGDETYCAASARLILGDHYLKLSERVGTFQTPGGTGALRVAAEFIKRNLLSERVWLPNPTWANHTNIFEAAGLETADYGYLTPETNEMEFDSLIAQMEKIPSGEVVLLHACCHNPSGVDPSADQWRALSGIFKQKALLPLFDFAYQGFGIGVDEDAIGVRVFASEGIEMLIAGSYSKNFSLYNERVGNLSVITSTEEAKNACVSQIKKSIRGNYSNPPAHGAQIVATILSDESLKSRWLEELSKMRGLIQQMRSAFYEGMSERGYGEPFWGVKDQCGMFSLLPLTREQVVRLRQEFAIYMVGSGRINLAGLNEANLEFVCDSIAKVMPK